MRKNRRQFINSHYRDYVKAQSGEMSESKDKSDKSWHSIQDKNASSSGKNMYNLDLSISDKIKRSNMPFQKNRS